MSENPVREVAPGVFLLDAHYVRPNLAACYVVKGRDSSAVVETGHAAAVPRILAALDQLGIPRRSVSHVLVTHVHLDHAGGAGALMRELPQATLIAHPRGARHLIDPTKLWAGTVQVYGAEPTKRLYGDPIAVPAERVKEAPDGFSVDLGNRRLTCLDAPGHAKHHLVVHDEASRGFFTGDCFGLSYRELDSAAGPFFYPTTTPVQFDPAALHATIDKILAHQPERVFLTHFGMVAGDLPKHAKTLHAAIDAFVACAEAAPKGEQRHQALKASLAEDLLARVAVHAPKLSRDEVLEIFDGDLDLDAAGLEIWLDSRGH
ncbi:MAG TPA: MBL fold metallo-hydrolase [Myxococcales bacterium]|jgi:glyoxylase-like metal-dependent hydrolase (beta-lactamase superfamily II)